MPWCRPTYLNRAARRHVPLPNAIFCFCRKFHGPAALATRTPGAFIPALSALLWGLASVHAALLACVHPRLSATHATLDLDATAIETYKHEVAYCYRRTKAS